MENRIFMVEDDKSICDMVKDYLMGENFAVDVFHSASAAIHAFQAKDGYALALIDLMLPDMSGMEIIKAIRKINTIPIIILTAKDNDTDKSIGFNLGADDYVVKPFSLIELTARIKANIRRAKQYAGQTEQTVIKIKDLEINLSTHTAKIADVPLDLTRTEFKILHLLATNPGQAFSKERIYNLIWKEPYFGNENVLNTHINRLRAKLNSAASKNSALKDAADNDNVYIKTLWGIGYKMEEK